MNKLILSILAILYFSGLYIIATNKSYSGKDMAIALLVPPYPAFVGGQAFMGNVVRPFMNGVSMRLKQEQTMHQPNSRSPHVAQRSTDADARKIAIGCFAYQRRLTRNQHLSDALIQSFCSCAGFYVAREMTFDESILMNATGDPMPVMAKTLTQEAVDTCSQIALRAESGK
jgi:hypothetical protein